MTYFDLHTHKKKQEKAIINLFHDDKPDENFLYSIGLHPMNIEKGNYLNDIKKLGQTAEHRNIIAIGECGLDKNTDISIDIQKEVLLLHIEIANILNKPLIIHCVGFYDELIKLLKHHPKNINIAIHGYYKNEIILNKFIDAGFYISPRISKKQDSNKLGKLLSIIPLGKLLLETDDFKDLQISEVYAIAAEILEIDTQDLAAQVHKNIEKFIAI